MCRMISGIMLLALGWLGSHGAHAGDWPQILGPNRDGIAVGETLLDKWPENGPDVIWQSAAGEGFAGVAVKGDLMVLFHRINDEEIAEGLAASTGKSLWQSKIPCSYQASYSEDGGPRCVPLISGQHVFLYGVEGGLRCLEAKTGKAVWSRDTWKDFSAPGGYFGAGSTPVLWQDRIIVNVGGRENSAVVAFDAADGHTLWQSFDDAASYSSPIVTHMGDKSCAVVVTRMNTLLLDVSDGSVLRKFPFGMRGPTVNGATPVVMNGHIFVSSSYRVGSAWADLNDASKPVTTSGEEFLATQYATPIRHKNLLYSVDGRQDIGPASLKCLDPVQQKVLWTENDFDYGTLLGINEDLLFLTFNGELIRFAADPAAFRQIHRSRVLEPTARSYRLPAISNGYLYVRDDKTLKCLHVGQRTQ